ncbi:hypothetical protein, partial [uncultured phage MedDCM-OCT-S12-C496]
IKARDPLQPTIAQLQGISPTAKVKATDVNKAFDLMDEMDGLAGENARKLRQFVEKNKYSATGQMLEKVLFVLERKNMIIS